MSNYDRDADATRVVIVGPSLDNGATPGAIFNPLDGPEVDRVALVTPNDGADIPNGPWRYVSFGTAGALKVVTSGGDTVTIPSGALGAGLQHILNVSRIWASGTTAANIVVYK